MDTATLDLVELRRLYDEVVAFNPLPLHVEHEESASYVYNRLDSSMATGMDRAAAELIAAAITALPALIEEAERMQRLRRLVASKRRGPLGEEPRDA